MYGCTHSPFRFSALAAGCRLSRTQSWDQQELAGSWEEEMQQAIRASEHLHAHAPAVFFICNTASSVRPPNSTTLKGLWGRNHHHQHT